jgi:hypothetical protein
VLVPVRAVCPHEDILCVHAAVVQPLVASGELYGQLAGYLKEGSLAGCSFSAGENDIESDRGAGILGVCECSTGSRLHSSCTAAAAGAPCEGSLPAVRAHACDWFPFIPALLSVQL